jgi:predicted DNA-binding transcriptional regulator AlpA
MAVKNTSLKPQIYFIKDAEEITRRNRLTLRRWWTKNLFPQPTLINNRLAWHADVIEQWIAQNIQGVQ